MRIISRFLLSASLLCMSQVAFADCDDPDALPDCIEVTPDENDSVDTSSSGGGAIYVGGGSTGGQQEGNTGNGGGSTSGETTSETSEPTDPPKTTRQKCLEDVAVTFSACKARASEVYYNDISTTCSGRGTVSGGVTTGLTATVSIEEYEQCKEAATAKRKNALDVCDLFKDIQTRACP